MKSRVIAIVVILVMGSCALQAAGGDVARAKSIAEYELASEYRKGWTIDITSVFLQSQSPGIDTYKVCYTAYPKFSGARPIKNATFVSKYKSNIRSIPTRWTCGSYSEDD